MEAEMKAQSKSTMELWARRPCRVCFQLPYLLVVRLWAHESGVRLFMLWLR